MDGLVETGRWTSTVGCRDGARDTKATESARRFVHARACAIVSERMHRNAHRRARARIRARARAQKKAHLRAHAAGGAFPDG